MSKKILKSVSNSWHPWKIHYVIIKKNCIDNITRITKFDSNFKSESFVTAFFFFVLPKILTISQYIRRIEAMPNKPIIFKKKWQLKATHTLSGKPNGDCNPYSKYRSKKTARFDARWARNLKVVGKSWAMAFQSQPRATCRP